MNLSFEGFLNTISTPKKTYSCETGEIVKIVGDIVDTIATRIPMIEYQNVKVEDDVVRFEPYVVLEGYDKGEKLEIFVYSLKAGGIEVEQHEVEELIEELYKKKWVNNRKELILLLIRYIKYYIKGYLEANYSIYAKCGWKKVENGREFYSVTKREGGDFSYIQDMFGWDVYRMFRRQETFSQILAKFNQCRELYDFLFENPVLIGVFVYTIHALTFDYFCLYDKRNYKIHTNYVENQDAIFFSICLHGMNIDTAKVIANILCNLFSEPRGSWIRISVLHHISALSLNRNFEKLRKYSSVPIIVTSKTNHIVKSSKIVTELYSYRKNMKLFIYPVYINDKSVNVDEMLNFNIDGIKLPFSVKDTEMAQKIHNQLTMLLFSFVCHLRDKSMGKIPKGEINNQENEEEVEQEWMEDNVPEFLLYTALKSFCDFLKPYQREEGEKLLSVYRKSIMNTGETEEPEQQIQAIKSDAQQRQRYLLYLHELTLDSLKKKEDWLWEGNESRGEKERCYYLDEKVWYNRFSEKLEKEKIKPIGIQEIAAILKEHQILKRYKSSTANVMRRKDRNCYVFLADVYDNKVSQWNTPPE